MSAYEQVISDFEMKLNLDTLDGHGFSLRALIKGFSVCYGKPYVMFTEVRFRSKLHSIIDK